MKIDDMRVDLFIYKSDNQFNKAWQDLIASGRIEVCGNSVRINH
jgi:hypothetical protein